MATIATLQRISAKSLSEKILEEREAKDPTFAVIDVRDDGKEPTTLKALFRGS
jgi:Cdc25 family phosphatase